MAISIHNRATRIIASVLVFFMLLLLIWPHLMDEEPPLSVNVVFAPAALLVNLISGFLPHPNIGTTEHPVYEGTPIDILAIETAVFLCIVLYSAVTYFLLSLVSRILRLRPVNE